MISFCYPERMVCSIVMFQNYDKSWEFNYRCLKKCTVEYQELITLESRSISISCSSWSSYPSQTKYVWRMVGFDLTCKQIAARQEVCAQIAKFGNDFKKFTKLSPCFCVSLYVFISIVQNLFFSLKIFDEKKCNSDDSCQMEKNFVS